MSENIFTRGYTACVSTRLATMLFYFSNLGPCFDRVYLSPPPQKKLNYETGFSHGSGRDIGIARSLPGEFNFDTSKAPALVEEGTPAAQLYSQITWPWNDIYLGLLSPGPGSLVLFSASFFHLYVSLSTSTSLLLFSLFFRCR